MIRFALAVSFFYCSFSFAEDVSGLGRADIVLKSDLAVGSNTVYAEIGRTVRSSAEIKSHFGYGIYISSWRICTELFHFKMAESSPERRMLPKDSAVSLSGKYQEYEQDGYRVQELLVDSPKDVSGVIFYCHCDEFRSLMGVAEETNLVSSCSGPRILLESFKSVVGRKADLKFSPPVLIEGKR